MNVRQQLYKKYRLSGLSAYRSAVKAGYSPVTAINAHRNIEKRLMFSDVLVQHGIDDNTLAEKLQEGLESKKLVAADVIIKNEKGKMVAVKNENDWVEYEDYNARHKYLETALQLKGHLKNKPAIEVDARTLNYVHIVRPERENSHVVEAASRPAD